MFKSILVGTDGSETAHTAVRRAIDLAAGLGARLQIVSAYEPVSDQRLRGEQVNVPADLQWMINPHDDVMALLDAAQAEAHAGGLTEVETFARQGDAADAIVDVAEEQRLGPDRRRQQGDDRGQALPARVGAEQGLAPRAVLGADRPDDLGAVACRRAARGSPSGEGGAAVVGSGAVAAPALTRPQP